MRLYIALCVCLGLGIVSTKSAPTSGNLFYKLHGVRCVLEEVGEAEECWGWVVREVIKGGDVYIGGCDVCGVG